MGVTSETSCVFFLLFCFCCGRIFSILGPGVGSFLVAGSFSVLRHHLQPPSCRQCKWGVSLVSALALDSPFDALIVKL